MSSDEDENVSGAEEEEEEDEEEEVISGLHLSKTRCPVQPTRRLRRESRPYSIAQSPIFFIVERTLSGRMQPRHRAVELRTLSFTSSGVALQFTEIYFCSVASNTELFST